VRLVVKTVFLLIFLLSVSDCYAQFEFDSTNQKQNTPKDSLRYTRNNDSTKTDTTKKTGNIDAIVEYSAKDSAEFDVAADKLSLYKDGDLKYSIYELKADRVYLYKSQSLMEANGILDTAGKSVGTPIFLESGQKYEASHLKYNFDTRKGNIEMGTTVLDGGITEAER